MKIPRLSTTALMLVCLCVTATSHAEHEADHRYQVFGSVFDTGQRPRANQLVQVRDGATVLESTTTDASGQYRIPLHLHDEDLGRRLIVGTGEQQTEIVVSFSRGDETTTRSHRVDFVGNKIRVQQNSDSGFVVPPALYYIGAVIAIVMLLAMAGRASRRRAQRGRTGKPRSKTPQRPAKRR